MRQTYLLKATNLSSIGTLTSAAIAGFPVHLAQWLTTLAREDVTETAR